VIADVAKGYSEWYVREIAIKKLTGQSVIVDIATRDRDPDVRAVAIHKLVNYDIEEDLRMNLIRVLGYILEKVEIERTRVYASEALMAYYKRYKIKEIEKYNGTHIQTITQRFSEHTDTEICHAGIRIGHTDSRTDDSYSYDIKFNTEK
jgi:hypothetical protein